MKFSSPKMPLMPSGTAPKISSTEGFQLLGAEQRGTIPWCISSSHCCPLSRDFLRHSRGFPARITLAVTRMNPRRCSGCGEGQGHPQEQELFVSLQRKISSNKKMNFQIRKKKGNSRNKSLGQLGNSGKCLHAGASPLSALPCSGAAAPS